MQIFTKKQWKSLLHKSVSIEFEPGKALEFEIVELVEADAIEPLKITPLSILFRGNRAHPIYTQGTYQISTREHGKQTLFLIPRQPDEHGIYYEAIFN